MCAPHLIRVYVDGANEHPGKLEIEAALRDSWTRKYERTHGPIAFAGDHDLKRTRTENPILDAIAHVRNPDIFYWLDSVGAIGGVEVTTHSPDGSNIEKRYPFLWACRRYNVPAIIATPYLKIRPTGSINRMPHRYAQHNLRLLDEWDPGNVNSALQQTIPIRELMGGEVSAVDQTLRGQLWSWKNIGDFLAHRAAQLLGGATAALSGAELSAVEKSLRNLGTTCTGLTRHEDASTLHKEGDRWIQTYNGRPDTGWWERGEGQFDSIDGRIMFTLDSISLMDPADQPSSLELWLPQMIRRHPWIAEQQARGFQSKKYRNLSIEIPNAPLPVAYNLKFADDLTNRDWTLLERNRKMRLERLVGPPEVFRLSDLVTQGMRTDFAQRAAISIPDIAAIQALIEDSDLWVSTARAYLPNWVDNLTNQLIQQNVQGRVITVRVPEKQVDRVVPPKDVEIFGAESAQRPLLLALRELHRVGALRS